MTETITTPAPARGKFTTRDVPWMKLGAVLDGGALTAAEAAQRGGLDYDVDLLPAGYRRGSGDVLSGPAPEIMQELEKLEDEVRGASTEALRKYGKRIPELLAALRWAQAQTGGEWVDVPNRRATVHHDTGKFMSFVSDGYVPVQLSEAFDFMDTISPRYVAAGPLNGGKQAFMVTELPERARLDVDVNGETDGFQLYAILRTSFDLSRALEVSIMTLRDRCMNALALRSFTNGAVQRWSVRHVGDPVTKMASAAQVLQNVDTYVEEFQETVRRMAQVEIELKEAEEIIRAVLPNRPRREEKVNAIVSAWRDDPLGTVGFGGTGYGLVNATSEYFEHGRESGVRTAGSRFTSGLNGDTYRYSNRVAQLVLRRSV